MNSENEDRREQFLVEMLKNIRDYNSCAANAIEDLADTQEKYPEEYDNFKEFAEDPTLIHEITEQIPDEDVKNEIRDTLFKIFLDITKISRKMRNIYDLSVEEKRDLAETMNEMINDMTNKLQKVEETIEEMNHE